MVTLGEKKYIYIDIYAIGGSLGPVGRDPQGARVNHAIGYTHSRVHTIYKKKRKEIVCITVDVPALYGYCAAW